MENLKLFEIHSFNQKPYILSTRYFPFHIFPAALVFLAIEFDISFVDFPAVDYHFRGTDKIQGIFFPHFFIERFQAGDTV